MEHWDAWLAEDVFRETNNNNANSDADATSSSSASTIIKAKSQMRQIPGPNANNKWNWDAEEEQQAPEGKESSSSTAIWTPKREGNQPALEKQEQIVEQKRIFVRQMLDEKMPLEAKLELDMPDELKQELRDWEAKFPNLCIFGKAVPKSAELLEREQLRRAVARQLVEGHLWPEIQSILSTKGGIKQQQEKSTLSIPTFEVLGDDRAGMKRKSPREVKKKKVETGRRIKLPAIKK